MKICLVTMFQFILIGISILTDGIQCRILDELDNNIPETPYSSNSMDKKDWLKITEPPPTKVIKPYGSSIELECEVLGTPTPTIHWVRGTNIQNSFRNYESNMIVESSSSAIVGVKSRLIIDHLLPNERSFTCVAQAGGKTAYASTIVFGTDKPNNFSELLGGGSVDGGGGGGSSASNMLMATATSPRKARITMFYSSLFELSGRDIILPCKVAGRPYPDIFWMTENDQIISNDDPHIRVLPSGDLFISSITFADMGTYTCIARNPLSKDSVSTFVYPLLNE